MRYDDPRHGSSSGYYAHKRAGQTPCDPCRLAVSEYQRRYKLGYRRIDGRDFTDQVEADDALTGGRWVLDKRARVMRWQKDPETIADPPAKPKRRYAKADEAICGTTAGYYRHKRKLKEPACGACRAAIAAAERDRVARREAGCAA